MSTWKVEKIGKRPKLHNPLFIEGLPGIGNVGKIAVDFIISELKAKKIYEITSHTFPNSVFVNENNLVELPIIEIFYKILPNGTNLLLLGGDVQPIDEASSYEFSELVLDITQKYGSKEIITLGGIGLSDIPQNPKVYCTGNSPEIIKKYKTKKVNNHLYGVVGPIVGATGLLVGLSSKMNIKAMCFLAETFGHPMYLGIKGAKELVSILNGKIKMNIDPDKLDKEIAKVEKDMKIKNEMVDFYKKTALKNIKGNIGGEINYIG